MQQNRAVCGIRRYTEADAGNALRSARHQDKNLPAESAGIRKQMPGNICKVRRSRKKNCSRCLRSRTLKKDSRYRRRLKQLIIRKIDLPDRENYRKKVFYDKDRNYRSDGLCWSAARQSFNQSSGGGSVPRGVC